ncbi:MAG: hypothetical protein HQM12_18250 [SAR324 cluster bacterium]|nr:hypothetical protein [SAR324 cluster bacterium]
MSRKFDLVSVMGILFEKMFNLGFVTNLLAHPLLRKQNSVEVVEYIEQMRNQWGELDSDQVIKRLVLNVSVLEDYEKKGVLEIGIRVLQKAYLQGYSFCQQVLPKEQMLCKIGYLQLDCSPEIPDKIDLKSMVSRAINIFEFPFNVDSLKDDEAGNMLKLDFGISLPQQKRFLFFDYSLRHFEFSALCMPDLFGNSSLEMDFTRQSVDALVRSSLSYEKERNLWGRAEFQTRQWRLRMPGMLNIPPEFMKMLFLTDREFYKMLQACSYANHLLDNTNFDFIDWSIITGGLMNGYPSLMNFRLPEDRENLRQLGQIYPEYKKKPENSKDKSTVYSELSFDVLAGIFGKDNAYKLFGFLERDFVNYPHMDDKDSSFEFSEIITTHNINNIELKKEHGAVVRKALGNPENEIFVLVGSPGTGKTFSVCQESTSINNLMVVYITPRLEVNNDFVHTFYKSHLTAGTEDKILSMAVNQNIINESLVTAPYLSGRVLPRLVKGKTSGIDWIPWSGKEEHYQKAPGWVIASETENIWEKRIHFSVLEAGEKMVLNAVNELGFEKLALSISAQACSKSPLVIFEKLFKVDELEFKFKKTDEFNNFRNRIHEIWIFIDEVTGSPDGLHNQHKIATRLIPLLKNSGFSVRLIVADASITSVDLYTHHSRFETVPECIYLNSIDPEEALKRVIEKPVKVDFKKGFENFGYSGVFINSNSYPASELKVTYRTCIKRFKFEGENTLKKFVKWERETSICEVLRQIELFDEDYKNDPDAQLFIYVQDKEFPNSLKSVLLSYKPPDGKKSLLVINSDFRLKEDKNEFRLVVVTSSASRGISFGNATRLVILVPSFGIATQHMEIGQADFRSRGMGNNPFGIPREECPKSIVYLWIRPVICKPDMVFDKLKVLTNFLIRAGSLKTRIMGGFSLNGGFYALTPVGPKFLENSATVSLLNFYEFNRFCEKNVDDYNELKLANKNLLKYFENVTYEHHETTEDEIKCVLKIFSAKKAFSELWLKGSVIKDSFYISGIFYFFKKKDKNLFSVVSVDKIYPDVLKLYNILKVDWNEELPEKKKFLGKRRDLHDKIMLFLEQILKKTSASGKYQKFFVSSRAENSYMARIIYWEGLSDYQKVPCLIDDALSRSKSLRYSMEFYFRNVFDGCFDFHPIYSTYKREPFLIFSHNGLENFYDRIYNSDKVLSNSRTDLMQFVFLEK